MSTEGIITVRRYDSPGRVRVERTPEGYLRTRGKLAKPGVLVYKRFDGTLVRELVEPEVLQSGPSNESLIDKSITIEHPEGGIDVIPDNWQELTHGDVSDPDYEIAGEEGEGLYGDLAFKSAQVLRLLADPQGPRELSPGYDVKLDTSGGVHPEYGPYDTRQIPGTRIYNHVALTMKARGGSDLTFPISRRDSAYEVIDMANTKTGSDTPHEEAKKKTDPDVTKKRDASEEGGEGEGGDRFDAFMERLDAFAERLDALEGNRNDATPEGAPGAEDEDNMSTNRDSEEERFAWYQERRKLEAVAERFNVKPDGLKNSDLKTAIVSAARPNIDVKKRDSAYVDAAFDLLAEDAGSTTVQDAWGGYGDELFGGYEPDAAPTGRRDSAGSGQGRRETPANAFLNGSRKRNQ